MFGYRFWLTTRPEHYLACYSQRRPDPAERSGMREAVTISEISRNIRVTLQGHPQEFAQSGMKRTRKASWMQDRVWDNCDLNSGISFLLSCLAAIETLLCYRFFLRTVRRYVSFIVQVTGLCPIKSYYVQVCCRCWLASTDKRSVIHVRCRLWHSNRPLLGFDR